MDWLKSRGEFALDSCSPFAGANGLRIDRNCLTNTVTWTTFKYPDYAYLQDDKEIRIVALIFPNDLTRWKGQTLTYTRFLCCFYSYRVGEFFGVGVAHTGSNDWWRLVGLLSIPTLAYCLWKG